MQCSITCPYHDPQVAEHQSSVSTSLEIWWYSNPLCRASSEDKSPLSHSPAIESLSLFVFVIQRRSSNDDCADAAAKELNKRIFHVSDMLCRAKNWLMVEAAHIESQPHEHPSPHKDVSSRHERCVPLLFSTMHSIGERRSRGCTRAALKGCKRRRLTSVIVARANNDECPLYEHYREFLHHDDFVPSHIWYLLVTRLRCLRPSPVTSHSEDDNELVPIK